MPLTAATTDLFQKVGSPGSATTLASPGYTIGNSSINVGATTNHPSDTKYTFAIDQAQVVNGVTSRIPGTYCEFEGILGGSNSINSLTLKYGSAQNYPAGSLTRVYIPVSSNRENQLIVGLRQDHNGKGNHQNLTDDNGNLWLERNQVASAVNQVRVSNSITGSGVAVEANGSDTNINVHLRGKGTGVAVLKNPELFSNFVASGGVIAQSSGLIGTFSDMAFYAGGDRFKKTSVPNKTYTINKDTYVDADPSNSSNVTYTEVANGATSPSLTSGYMRVGIVVTNGTAISTIQQSGFDTLGNKISYSGAIQGSNAPGMFWEELGRVTVVSSAQVMSILSFTPKKYLRVLIFAGMTTASGNINVRFNNDSGNNYAHRFSSDGGVDATATAVSTIPSLTIPVGGLAEKVMEVTNSSLTEKLIYCRESVSLAVGAGSVPDRLEQSGKWSNNAQVTRIDVLTNSTGSFPTGSEVIVLGHN